jgi:hypothetical protein
MTKFFVLNIELRRKTMKKIILSLIAVLALNAFAFSYETTKATKILSDPNSYNGKKVLIYVKFDSITSYGIFTDFLVDGINYHYDTNNSAITNILKDLQQRDLITVKGQVYLDGFNPNISVDSIVKGWIDTTLLPATPKTIDVTCPNCGYTFKYNLQDKKVEEKTKTTTQPVVNPQPEKKEEVKPKPKQKKQEEEEGSIFLGL